MADNLLEKFATDLLAEVEESLSSDVPFSEEAFTRTVLERLEEAGHLESAFPLYQEGRIRNAIYRIDGYSHDEERSKLDLFTTIYSADLPPAKIPGADTTKAFDRALRFASACVDGLADQLEPSNTDASDLARLIEAESGSISTIRVILLTNGITSGFSISGDWKGRQVEYEVYDIVRLFRVLGQGETRADISVDLEAIVGSPVPCLHVPSQDGGYEAYLTVIPGEALSKVYDRYGVRLLELNVRAFLGLQGRKSVNAELRRTIIEQPSMFLAFNNGIVATVDDVVLTDTGGGPAIRELRGLQIVNGGQTTASLHRALRKDHTSLEGVAVPVKIIRVGGADLGEMVSSISRAANRQNTIQLADFSANDPFHQAVETLANNTWLDDGKGRWFYERARGSYLAAEQKAALRRLDQQSFRIQTPKTRRFNKLDVARYLSAWSGLPFRVCLGGQKNFQHFMQRLRDEPQPPPDLSWFKRLIAIAILYRAIERKVRSMKFPAYNAQIAAYLIAGLSHKVGGRLDFDRIWSRQSISSELEELVSTWAPQLDRQMRESAGQRNPSEWYKKEDCWKEVQRALPDLVESLPPELTYFHSEDTKSAAPMHSVVDYDRIARCLDIDGTTWLSVAERGHRAGLIHWKVAGICRTLASYAAGGWERKPSAKQAKPALDAFNIVQEAGLLKTTEEAS